MPCDKHLDLPYGRESCRICLELDSLPELVSNDVLDTTHCTAHGFSLPCGACAFKSFTQSKEATRG